MNLTQQAQKLVSRYISEGDIVIDATAGNGHDTLFLAQQVGKTGHVFAFDIQVQAIQNTEQLLQQHGLPGQLSIFHSGHENLSQLIPLDSHPLISVFMFNLGYLPGSDKTCITRTKTTLSALQQSLDMLKAGGVISIMLYPGHKGGDEEAEAVINWVENETEVSMIKQLKTNGPQFLLLQKTNRE